mmetsp:Transcript_10516/g.15589  ORF Transcript_10516/g.15589 Transcript_10516/m.15589 type:complete len:132 (+) Transcript_10516:428-823(+)
MMNTPSQQVVGIREMLAVMTESAFQAFAMKTYAVDCLIHANRVMTTRTVFRVTATLVLVLELISKLTMDAAVSLAVTVILVGVTPWSACLGCPMDHLAMKTPTVFLIAVAGGLGAMVIHEDSPKVGDNQVS